jgi:hypothetical protein
MTDLHDEQLDASLQRLPHWEPPADFAQRLAAAATRQALRSQARPTHAPDTAARLLDAINARLPLTVLAGVGAVVLATLPWERLAQHPATTATLTAALLGAAGLWLTLRALRS